MAVIDTTDYSNKRNLRPQPPPPEPFEDFDEDIDVPYMTTIDTTQSSADSYQPRGQRRRGAGPRPRHNQPSYGDNRSNSDRQNYAERQPYREHHSNRDGNEGRQGHRSQNVPSQDARFPQSQDARISPRQDSYAQDYPSLNHRPGGYQARNNYSQDMGSREPRGQGEYRNRANRRADEEVEDEHVQRNSYNRASRGGPRGGLSKPARGRERNDHNNRPPRYSRIEREERPSNLSNDLTPAAREFTNSSLRNNPSSESPGIGGKNSQVSAVNNHHGKAFILLFWGECRANRYGGGGGEALSYRTVEFVCVGERGKTWKVMLHPP